jgi:fructose/tagatose bisphosphate aldolase
MRDPSRPRLLETIRDVVDVSARGEIVLLRPQALAGETTDLLVRKAVFGKEDEAVAARWLVRELARLRGIRPASIQPLYEAMGRGELAGFTTPALNLRGLAYDSARAAFDAMHRLRAGPVVFELARSEMAYTAQPPAEYATVVLAAALREGHEGPVFLQGDHFQVNAGKFRAGGEARASEIRALSDLVSEAIAAGFYNIDIDASTLVDLRRSGVGEQQRDNFTIQAELTALVRRLQPRDVVVSVGGEIGEVGGRNSTPEELRAFMQGFLEEAGRRGGVPPGVSKISVQTGTTHGGVVLPDGTVAKVKIDFECLRALSEIARREYGMAGAVQHGASTLPPEAFVEFPKHGAAEVHLATEFQNLVLDHADFPRPLQSEMYAWLEENCAAERKAGMTDEQFHYKTRKKAWGPFKARTWDLPEEVCADLRATLRARFEFLFEKLGVSGGEERIARFARPPEVRVAPPASWVVP